MIERPAPRNPWVASYGPSDTNYANPGSSFQNAPDSSSYGPGSSFQNAPGAYGPSPGSTYQSNQMNGGAPYSAPAWSQPGDPSQPAPTTSGYLTDLGNWSRQQGINAATAAAAPGRIALQGQMAGDLYGIAGAQANQSLESGYLNQNYGLANARNQLAMQNNQVDIGANARQPGFLTALHNIAGQQFDLSRQGEQTNADVNRRGLESKLTGQGAFTSIGGQQGRFDIANQLLQQTQGTNLQQQGEGVNYNEKMATANDQKQQLAIKAQDLGITGDQLKASLDQGLGRLNLSTGMTTADLMNKINSGTLQDNAMGQKIFGDALQYSDYYQRSGLYPGQNAAAGDAGAYNPLTGAGTESNVRGAAGGTFR
jgi:hypothetical protein